MMNTTTMIPCRCISERELAIMHEPSPAPPMFALYEGSILSDRSTSHILPALGDSHVIYY